MPGENLRDQLAAGCGQMNEKRAAIAGVHHTADQAFFFETIDDAGDIGATHQQLAADVAHFHGAEMGQALQHAELRGGQIVIAHGRRLRLGKRIIAARQDDPEFECLFLARRIVVAVENGLGCQSFVHSLPAFFPNCSYEYN